MSLQVTNPHPGQSAPFEVITSTDRHGLILITMLLGFFFTLVTLLVRVYVRHRARRLVVHQFALDDLFVVLSMACFVFQLSATWVAVAKGFGKTVTDVSPAELVALQKALYASELLYLVTVWLTKFSVAFLFLRLSPIDSHILATKASLLAGIVFMHGSIFVIALRCDLACPWIFIGAQCTHVFVRWQVFAVFDVITESALVSLSAYLVYRLRMAPQKKFTVVLAFSFRLLMIVPIAFRLRYLGRELASSNQTLDGVFPTICIQIEMSYAIIAASIPCMRPFMTATSTSYGAPQRLQSLPRGTETKWLEQAATFLSAFKRFKLGGSQGKAKPRSASTMNPSGWNQLEHHISMVSPGDHPSVKSQESRRNIRSNAAPCEARIELPERHEQSWV